MIVDAVLKDDITSIYTVCVVLVGGDAMLSHGASESPTSAQGFLDRRSHGAEGLGYVQ